MYEPDTILALKRKRSRRGEEFPYDRVRVIGTSPQTHSHAGYEGRDAAGVVIQPLNGFGSTIDEPFGKLRQIYDVESVPEHIVPKDIVKVIMPGQLGPSPEELFAEASGNAQPAVRAQAEPILPDPPRAPDSPL